MHRLHNKLPQIQDQIPGCEVCYTQGQAPLELMEDQTEILWPVAELQLATLLASGWANRQRSNKQVQSARGRFSWGDDREVDVMD